MSKHDNTVNYKSHHNTTARLHFKCKTILPHRIPSKIIFFNTISLIFEMSAKNSSSTILPNTWCHRKLTEHQNPVTNILKKLHRQQWTNDHCFAVVDLNIASTNCNREWERHERKIHFPDVSMWNLFPSYGAFSILQLPRPILSVSMLPQEL